MQAGDTIKLRERPKDLSTKFNLKKLDGRGNDPGYGKNDKYESIDEMDNLQPSPKPFCNGKDAVHRLNGSGGKRNFN